MMYSVSKWDHCIKWVKKKKKQSRIEIAHRELYPSEQQPVMMISGQRLTDRCVCVCVCLVNDNPCVNFGVSLCLTYFFEASHKEKHTHTCTFPCPIISNDRGDSRR